MESALCVLACVELSYYDCYSSGVLISDGGNVVLRYMRGLFDDLICGLSCLYAFGSIVLSFWYVW